MNIVESQIQEYLRGLITIFPTYTFTKDEERLVKQDVSKFIIQKLLRKKVRKQKLHPDTINEFTKKINARVKEKRPIHFTIPFGGYKHYWNKSHPQTDWAEIFTLRFLTEWVSPILAVYKPGVVIDFISEDLILTRMNNYPKESLDVYSQSFSSLIEIYSSSLPDNFKINYFRIGERYNKRAIIKDVEKLLPSRWEKWESYSLEEKEIELKRSKRAIMWRGNEDLSTLNDKEKEKRIIESRLVELAYYEVEEKPEYLGEYYTEDNRIGICFSFGLSPDNFMHWITLGSTYASTVDFWIGRGILEMTSKGFIPRVISKEQYQKIKSKIHNIRLIFKNLPSKNYQSVEVISSSDWSAILTS